MHHLSRKPSTTKPTRQPAIPPTTAAVLMDPEEPEVAEGVADVVVRGLRVTPVIPVAIEVVCTVTTDGGVWQSVNYLYLQES